MKSPNQIIKIKLDTSSLTAEDVEDLGRWENEGGHPGERPDLISSLPLPLHKEEIFEVVSCEIVVEEGQVLLMVELNILSHH